MARPEKISVQSFVRHFTWPAIVSEFVLFAEIVVRFAEWTFSLSLLQNLFYVDFRLAQFVRNLFRDGALVASLLQLTFNDFNLRIIRFYIYHHTLSLVKRLRCDRHFVQT